MGTNNNQIRTGNGSKQSARAKREGRVDTFQRRAAWAILAGMNMCGWYLLLGPVDVCSTAGTHMSYLLALSAYYTAAVLLVVGSLAGVLRMLPEDFFDE